MSEASRVQPAGQRTGNIYDLGYRGYDGPRMGRRYAFTALFTYSVLSIWGIGRSWLAKLFPWGLAVIAAIPAFTQLAIAALVPAEFEFVAPEEYYGFVSIVLALICAVAAPDLIGRDQRHRTLALYFSRALDRVDYGLAKLSALIVSLFIVLSVPQVLLQLGNGVATDDLTDYFQNNLDLIPPILASSALVAVFMASMTLAISVHTSRRAFATGAVIAGFVILTAMGGILVNTLEGGAKQVAILISPFDILEGMVYWLFSAETSPGSDLTLADLPGGYYVLAVIVYTVVYLGVLYRRIVRMNV